jgi:thiamine-phosphate pyrophosphorylase
VAITEAFCAGRPALDVLDACLDAGVRVVQFREKNLDTRVLYEKAAQFRARTAAVGALFIVNDRLDVAMAVEADGVHLGQSDLPFEAARRIAPDLILGASSHNLEEAVAAQAAGASYVNVGPIFATQTKTVAGGAVGPERFAEVAPHLSVPLTCMGGIKAHNVGALLACGARHIAVVTAVTAAPDVRAAAEELRGLIRAAR